MRRAKNLLSQSCSLCDRQAFSQPQFDGAELQAFWQAGWAAGAHGACSAQGT
jgi:hypothetical protein